MNSRTAVVVGGGIGGLAAALGLVRIGWQVRVLERDPVLDDAGAGISVQANGLRALDVVGVGDAVRSVGAPQGSGGIRTPNGRWLSHLDAAEAARLLGTPVYSFQRADLHRALRAALPAGCLVAGATVDEVLPGPDLVEIRYTEADSDDDNGDNDDDSGSGRAVITKSAPKTTPKTTAATRRTATAALVVAADGVHSRVRRRLWPDHGAAAYAGTTIWRGITATPIPTPVDIDQTWGRGTEFGSTRLPDGRVEWHAGINAPAGIRHPDPLAEVRRRFGTWHDPIPALLDATDPDTVLHHDVYELRAPLPSYVAHRVVLLGDAAHAMTPHLGQGASQALADAVSLAAFLAAGPDPDAALARYDRERRPTTQAVVTAARRTGRIGQQLHSRPAVALRNLGMRITPSSVAVKAMVKNALWEPPAL